MVPKLLPRALAIRQAHLQHVPRPPSPAPPLPSFVCVDSTNTTAQSHFFTCTNCGAATEHAPHPSTQRISSLPDTLAAVMAIIQLITRACEAISPEHSERPTHVPPMAKTNNFQIMPQEMPLQISVMQHLLVSALFAKGAPSSSRPVAHTPTCTTFLWCSVLSRRKPLPTSRHDAVCEPTCAGDSWHARRPSQGRTTGHVQGSC